MSEDGVAKGTIQIKKENKIVQQSAGISFGIGFSVMSNAAHTGYTYWFKFIEWCDNVWMCAMHVMVSP